MQYVAWLVRGMTVDEAIKQLSFVLKKGGAIVKETILEAQKLAVEKHNVEFKSNLWVGKLNTFLVTVLCDNQILEKKVLFVFINH